MYVHVRLQVGGVLRGGGGDDGNERRFLTFCLTFPQVFPAFLADLFSAGQPWRSIWGNLRNARERRKMAREVVAWTIPSTPASTAGTRNVSVLGWIHREWRSGHGNLWKTAKQMDPPPRVRHTVYIVYHSDRGGAGVNFSFYFFARVKNNALVKTSSRAVKLISHLNSK